ncbi:MAG: hypothetical protein QMD78_04915, partial [Methanocellales archaeon]|nr:hypothetical protein [Methanocellales archaeon]
NSGGATTTTTDDAKILEWSDLENNSIVSYSVQAPLVCPYLYELGPAQIDYGSKTFTEARPWYVAADPIQTKSPSANSGSWASGANAYSSDNLYASSNTPDATHDYYNYSFTFPAGSTITSVEIGAEYYYQAITWHIDFQESWDGGTTWSTARTLSDKTADDDIVVWTDVTADTSWTPDKLSDSNFMVRIIAVRESQKETVYMDWLPVRVTHNAPPGVETPKTYNSSLTETSTFEVGENVTVRVNVTDADGAADIDAVLINITNPASVLKVENGVMVNISPITNGYIYEYNYTIPIESASIGTWTINVTANDTAGASDMNSTTFTARDTTKPAFHSPGLSKTELLRYIGEKVELWINITDNIAVDTANFTIKYPNGTSYNFTASLKNGTNQTGFWNYTFDSTGQPLGTYNWTFAHANDTSDNWNSTSVNLEFVVKSPVLDVSIYEYQNVTRLSSYDFNASVTNSGNINATDTWLNWTLPANWTITAGDQDKFLGNLTPSQKEWNNITVKINLTADLGPKEIMANSTCDEVQGGDTKTIYVWASTSIPSVLIDNTNPVQGETVKIDARLIYDNTSAIADQNMRFYYENETGLYSIGSNFTNASGWATFDWDTSTVAYGTYNVNATYAGNSSILWTLASHNNTQTVKVQPKAGPNCHYCHDVGTLPQRSEYKVNISLMNETLAIHKYLNKDATSTTQNESDKRCWACHGDDDGDEIANETEQPGDRHSVNYDVPKKCDDCHIEGNFSAPIVREHYSVGDEIKTNVSLGINESCISCHNETEMKLDYSSDPDPRSGYAAISHYGKNRSDLIVDSSTNCSYCHQNESTVFPFVYACNKTIKAHTPRTTINCINSTCHNAGRIHATSLQVRRLGSENTTYCQNSGCHAGRETHNATVNCTTCHAYIPRDIHPIKYLLQNDTYGTSNATAVNCTTCHMSTVVDANLTPSSAPKIPTSTNFDFNHSEDEMAGHKWNKVYWDNTSDLSACMYCHNDTKHNVTAIGVHVSIIAYNDTRNTTISTTSYWCAGCHYQGDENYTEMVALFESKGMPVPPEITGNASYAPGTAADGTDYEDHSAYGFHDEACANCHGALLKLMTTVEFKHAVAIGVPGNPNCTTCHDLGGVSKYHVDVQAMNTTSYTHYNLNNQSAI